MGDELLSYYERELTYVRHLAAKFAEDHPKIAQRLRLGPESADDPHVERLIEAFAYLTARVRHKLDDEFPEIVGSLLDVLYPHYQAPIPSMAIVQFKIDPFQVTGGYEIRSEEKLETEPIEGEPCRFRTCYPVTLWPIEVSSAGLMQAPFVAPNVPVAADAISVLRLSLKVPSPELSFAMLGIDSLRFFLKGQPQHVFRLYQLLFNNAIGVAVARDARDPAPLSLGPGCLRPVGFETAEALLQYPARSFLGYRLITEYFAFPQKFLFADLVLPKLEAEGRWGNQLEIFIYLNRVLPDLPRVVSADTFQLGCTPIVNLYDQRAEPIQLKHTEFEYRVVPDARLPFSHEVYGIKRVSASSPRGETAEFQPFFSVKHSFDRGTGKTFWHASRREAEGGAAVGDNGTEVYVSLVDLNFRSSIPADWILDIETTCLNRDLPERLPFGGDQPRLQMSEGHGSVARIVCLTPPTRTLRPPLGHGRLWRLISHLSLNHLSIVDDGKAEALREILKLYDFADSAETRNQIDGILQVSSQRVVGSVGGGGPVSFCRGTETTLLFDEDRFSGSGMFLFASVLERFLALYCTMNSFSKLVVRVKGREGELRRWPPRIGEMILA